MHRLFVISMLMFFGINYVNGQKKINIKGIIQDSSSRIVSGASVLVIFNNDSLKTKSNADGTFGLQIRNIGKFYLEVSALGYKSYRRSYFISDSAKEVSIIVTLRINIINLDTVVIKGKIEPVIIKEDTLEYNTAAYKTDGTVANLLQQLPGVEVDQLGNVVTDGSQVTRLRVNGVDFFTGDVNKFINELPADIFDKVQVINDYGDEAAFTGIKKGKPVKLLNLVTKQGMDKGTFGDIRLNAGTEGLYGGSVNENFWKRSQQISFKTSLNTQKNTIGISNNNNVGLTYNNHFTNGLEVTSNYILSYLRQSSQNMSFAETISPMGTLYDKANNTDVMKDYSHHINVVLTYRPNDSEFLKSTIDASLSPSTYTSGMFSSQSGIIRQDLLNQSNLSNNNPQINSSIYWGKKLNKSGRLITAAVKLADGTTEANQQINNVITYYDSTYSPVKDSALNDLSVTRNRMKSVFFSIVYSEPLTINGAIDFSYGLNLNRQNNSIVTNLDIAPYSLIEIDSLSQRFSTTLFTQTVGLDLRYSHKKIRMLFGMNLQKDALMEDYVNNPSMTNNVTNFSPTLNFHYTASENNDYEFNYYGSSIPPTFDQLQTVKDIRNLQNIVIGNPNLKPSFSHSLKFVFRHFGLKSHQTLFLNVTGSLIQNQIITTTSLVKDTLGNLAQMSSYSNVNGSYNMNLDYDWSILFNIHGQPFKLSFNGSANFNYGIIYVDSLRSHNTNKAYSQIIRLNSFSKSVSFDAQAQYQKSYNLYFIDNNLSTSLQVWSTAAQANIKITNQVSFNIEMSKRLNQGYTNINVNNPFIVNSYLQLTPFRKSSMTLELKALDVFNESNSVNQVIAGNTVTNTQSNYITRYFILSIDIPIRKFPKAN